MALFEEKKIEGQFAEQFNLAELPKGQSVLFYIAETKVVPNQEYGDFVVWEGLRLDDKASTPTAAIEGGVYSSVIPNTMLLNLFERKGVVVGRLYRIEKAWDRGDKFKDGKPAKGFGYDVFELSLSVKDQELLPKVFMSKAVSSSDNKNTDKKEEL